MEGTCGDHEYGGCHGTGRILCTWCGDSAMCEGCEMCSEEEEEWDA